MSNNEEKTDEQIAEEMEEELVSQDLKLKLAQYKFSLSLPDEVVPVEGKKEAKTQLLEAIKKENITHYYQHVAQALGWKEDAALVATFKENNEKKLKELDEKIKDAETNLGDTEIREAKMERANYLATIGQKDEALVAYDDTLKATIGSGQRIDVVFSKIRLGLQWNDIDLVRENIEKAKTLVEAGGDWERRNLLGVYNGIFLIITREFKEAAQVLLKAVATFTCYDLCDYNTFIFYTVVLALVSVDRVTLRDKVIKSPDILSVIDEIPNLRALVFSLYKCQYKDFFNALSDITPQMKQDRYLSTHFGFYLREIRIVAYTQFLESYRSVTLASMAAAFGVSVDFLDRELSRFIAAKRLNCKVDKVGGIVETNRPDAKNTQYQDTIREGDLLLNRIQKLTKVISY